MKRKKQSSIHRDWHATEACRRADPDCWGQWPQITLSAQLKALLPASLAVCHSTRSKKRSSGSKDTRAAEQQLPIQPDYHAMLLVPVIVFPSPVHLI